MLGLYSDNDAKDNCGFGLICHIHGEASHRLLQQAIQSLSRMMHRGAIAADGKSGDGCGVLVQMPKAFFREVVSELGHHLGSNFAVGQIFFNPHPIKRAKAQSVLTEELQRVNLPILCWRKVPVDASVCGHTAFKYMPAIEQCFINAPNWMHHRELERRLFIARRLAVKRLRAEDPEYYVVSLSSKVICYKAMVLPSCLSQFYTDLQDERFQTAICLIHQRFSTNTSPRWRLAQPFRFLAHNGEINTITGNRIWARAHTQRFATKWLPDMTQVEPTVNMAGSDSSSLDNMLEVLFNGGMDIFRAMRILIPPAWQNFKSTEQAIAAFYDYHAMHMEPWDGPAGIVLTDGRRAASLVDRNGLRPVRYLLSKDHILTIASESGVHDLEPKEVVTKGRLKAGEMLGIDTKLGKIIWPKQIDARLKKRRPYRQWLQHYSTSVQEQFIESENINTCFTDKERQIYEKLFQVSYQEREQVIKVLANLGQEATASMGDDTPIAVLSQQIRPLYDYFRQQFAQVTNPPIDSLREKNVMSLETYIGIKRNIFDETPVHAERLILGSPIISSSKFKRLLALTGSDTVYKHIVISLNRMPAESLPDALSRLSLEAEQAVRKGHRVLVLSDKAISQEAVPVHALLATGAIHHHLLNASLRSDANLIIETGTARDPHHFAVLLGYGASAIYPYLAFELICAMNQDSENDVRNTIYLNNYIQGIEKGLLKIMAKMGISTLASYRAAQLYEVLGLSNEIVDRCFTGSASRIGGAEFIDLEQESAHLHQIAWSPAVLPMIGGQLRYIENLEYHAYNPQVVLKLHEAVEKNCQQAYDAFSRAVNQRPISSLRDLFAIESTNKSIEINQVQSSTTLYKRFDCAGMSLGAISPESHEALAVAMNQLGGRSNSGEGGEHADRYATERMSKIKQLASGRFGVNAHYLVNAEVLQIKIAQGAKPGEGGQLPGEKVNSLIAELRCATPGTTLISPPPHHDIYSIEDIAQLIFDLKQVNPNALISVKLVAEPGVGTIASGVAKAYADVITVSGFDGGTGASPLTSIKYAGSAWELGLAETHQALCANKLRHKVILQVDGGLKTGLDVIKAAILGAESFGFGTAPLIALGCKYLRLCHLNNCATGIATQNEHLRSQHYVGSAERVVRYFQFVAAEIREILAKMGFSRLEDIIGQTHLLKIIPGQTTKQNKLDLSALLINPYLKGPQFWGGSPNAPFDQAELAHEILQDCQSALTENRSALFCYKIKNYHRSIGGLLSGEISRQHGGKGIRDNPIHITFHGTAGQSFGVWNVPGLNLKLLGDANDYVGKGMSGGKIIIHPPAESSFQSHEATIVGNTCLYGATGGVLHAAGLAGERFAVRNSGAIATVEGVGDHACEYMTGGVVLILGPCGMNFGAGMTGGIAYVLDLKDRLPSKINPELVELHRIHLEETKAHADYLKQLLEQHVIETQSHWASQILNRFSEKIWYFWIVKPKNLQIDAYPHLRKQS